MIALALLAAHMIGDYIMQTGWMAANKLLNWRARAIHVTAYTAAFIPVVVLTKLNLSMMLLFVALVWITHFITDCRRWASADQWAPKPILVDQSIHIATLAILGIAFRL